MLCSPSNPIPNPTDRVPCLHSRVLVLAEIPTSVLAPEPSKQPRSHGHRSTAPRSPLHLLCTSGSSRSSAVSPRSSRRTAHHHADRASPTYRSAGRPVGDRRREGLDLQGVRVGALSKLGVCPETLLGGLAWPWRAQGKVISRRGAVC